MLFSCKTKYLEMEAKLDKARTRKAEMEKENRALKSELAKLSDSLSVVEQRCEERALLYNQVITMEALKKEFLEHKVPYYLQMKQRQQKNNKSKK